MFALVPLRTRGKKMLCRGEVPSVKVRSLFLLHLCGIGCPLSNIFKKTEPKGCYKATTDEREPKGNQKRATREPKDAKWVPKAINMEPKGGRKRPKELPKTHLAEND